MLSRNLSTICVVIVYLLRCSIINEKANRPLPPPFLLSKAKTSCSSPPKKSQQKLHSGQSFSFDGMPYKCNKSRKGQEEVIITICEKLYIHQGHSRKERMSLFKPYRVSKKTCTMFLIYFLVDLPQTKP